MVSQLSWNEALQRLNHCQYVFQHNIERKLFPKLSKMAWNSIFYTQTIFSRIYGLWGYPHPPSETKKRTLLILFRGGFPRFLHTRGTHQLRRFQNSFNRFGSSLSFGARAFSSLPSASSASSPTLPPSSLFSLRRWISIEKFQLFPHRHFSLSGGAHSYLKWLKGITGDF